MALFVGFGCLGVSTPASAEKRVALVIGNDAYANLPVLQKAANDATAVGDTLAKLGYNVLRGRNLGRQQTIDKLSEFTAQLEAGDTAVFFYAGHGIAIGNVNYIVPVDAPAATAEARVRGASISEPEIIEEIRAKGTRISVLVLDACRDNPFPRTGARTVGNSRGLTGAPPARGVFVLYSAGAGQTALDRLHQNDPNRNSVFTRVFVEQLAKPGLHIGDLAVEVREQVAEIAKGARNDNGEIEPHEQTPAYYDQTIGGRVFLAGRSPTTEQASPKDEIAWNSLKDSTDIASLRRFSAEFPASPRQREAEARIAALERETATRPKPDTERPRPDIERQQPNVERQKPDLERQKPDVGRQKVAVGLPSQTVEGRDRIKIGILTTLSGPAGALGTQQSNGFQLAVKQMGGKLGGREVELIIHDDQLKPDVAVTKAKEMVDRDKVDFVVGPVFSNILIAIMKPVTDQKVFLLSPNPGTSNFAGKECNANLFVTSYQNDQNHEVMGKYAQDSGVKKAFIMAPNYQTGKDALAGFKRYFEGELVGEIYLPLGTLDYSGELSKISASGADAIFVFLPGGMGVNFVKQFRQAGLAGKIKFLSSYTVDELTLQSSKETALGFFGGANWAPDLDTPQNRIFVAYYEKEYSAVPSAYAAHGYDTAYLIDSALKATKGNTANKDALRAALAKADFTSVRGAFKFNTNHYPIQDFYLVKVAGRPDGKFQTEIVKKVFTNHIDPHVINCSMK
jgi:branched-chain amino acid transport system substrate-binding protein